MDVLLCAAGTVLAAWVRAAAARYRVRATAAAVLIVKRPGLI